MGGVSKLRIAFVLSLLVLAGVFVLTLYFVPSGQDYPEPRRAQIINAGDEWILQYDIINNGNRDIEYTISVTIDSRDYTDTTIVKQGKAYTYIHHIYPQQLTAGEVSLTVYEDAGPEPIEHATYHINLNQH